MLLGSLKHTGMLPYQTLHRGGQVFDARNLPHLNEVKLGAIQSEVSFAPRNDIWDTVPQAS